MGGDSAQFTISTALAGRQPSRAVLSLLAVFVAACFLAGFLVVLFPSPVAEAQSGDLTVDIIAGYNLVVDSNAGSPSTFAPSVATVVGRFCNVGGSTINGVQGYIGNYNGGVSPTPGIYPARDSSDTAEFPTDHPLYDTGWYTYSHLGGNLGTADATRFVGTLASGECKVQYWHFTYPQCSNVGGVPDDPPCDGIPVWGDSVKPEDDLWLEFDIWGEAPGGHSDDERWRMTMRNEISAMANKIEPNPDGEWFNTTSDVVRPGDVITSNGILYELGNVRHGFDNDNDYVPDYNAWLQPVGDAAYDPSCFRLIRTHGVITVSRGAGKPDLIIEFKDWEDPHPVYGGPLYFTNLPDDNNGVKGNVYYTFLALDGPCLSALSPYQEVASGYDNEKFNGDFGGAMPPNVGSAEPEVTVDKQGNITVSEGTRMTYTVALDNPGTADAGLPLYSMPLVVSDTVPASTTYASVDASVGVEYRYLLTDGTYTSTLPADTGTIVAVQWWLTDTLAAGNDGVLTFSVDVDSGASGVIENCAETSFGGGAAFDEDCTTTIIEGVYRIGDFVWRDLDNDAIQDGGESGIDGVTVWLYYDVDGDGALDTDVDLLVDSKTTAGGGIYTFTNLSAGDFLVRVDTSDPQIPEGFRLTTGEVVAVALSLATDPYLDADFGFGPSLKVDKEMVGGAGYEGREVSYNIVVRNLRPGGGEDVAGGCEYTVWAGKVNSDAETPASGTGNQAWGNPSGALGSPDGEYASSDLANNDNSIGLAGFNVVPQAGNIISVVVELRLLETSDLATNDQLQLTVYLTDTAGNMFPYTGGGYFTGGSGQTYVLREDVTAENPSGWAWSHFAADTTELLLAGNKSGGTTGFLELDAAAFKITTDEACPLVDSDDVLALVPLTDTYDTTLLQYVSASPPPSDIDTSSGVITWTNIGPIYPGQSEVVQVNFLGRDLGSPAVANNTACSIDAEFSDGAHANDDCDNVSGYITPTGYISGVVWSDLPTLEWQSPNGYESNDPGIPGVTVNLFYCEGLDPTPAPNQSCEGQTGGNTPGTWGLIESQVTGANGHYFFDGLADGYYYISVTQTSVPGNLSATDDADDTDDGGAPYPCGGSPCSDTDSLWNHPGANIGDMQKLSVSAVGAITNTNFGYTVQPSLFGTVWEDVDGDSIQESGEEGIAGVVVTLTYASGVSTTVTDANGYYTFTDLTAGTTYTITVDTDTLPPGGSWTQTDDPDFDLDDEHTVTVAAGEISGSHDFGYHRHSGPYSIGDTVYADWNGDGDRDTGEEGLSGITVTLYTNTGAYVTETVTSGTGYYIFTGLVTGTYRVVVDTDGIPSSWDDYEETQDPDEADTCSTCDNQGSSTVSSTFTSDPYVDFGYRPTGYGSIGDYVWHDEDGDGQQDWDETGLANITVSLYEDDGDSMYEPGVDALIMTTTTGADGDYLFQNLSAGDYFVIVDTSDGDLPTDGFGVPYYLTTSNNPHPVTLITSQDYVDADFGFTAPGAIGDYIWQDNNGDGVQDAGEPGIANVTVELYIDTDGDGTGDVLSATTTTDANGIYSFTNIVSDTYVVVVDDGPLSGFAQTGDPDWSTACGGTGNCDGESALTLRAGQIDMSRDFGYEPGNVVGDYVWFDMNGDGVQDSGEAPIAGVVLTLTNGSVYTTTTDQDGYYSFGDLGPGTFTVTVDASTLPLSVTQATYDYDGAGTPHQAAVTLSGSGSNLDVDFGYRYDGSESITGHVFFDGLNNGGTYDDVFDTPYEGITVYLINSSGRQVAETTTDANGAYTFTNLAALTYTVSVNRNSAQLAGTTLTATPNPDPTKSYNTVVASAADQDFGFFASMDFGDLPDTYNITLLSDEGPYHRTGSLWLGSSISTEADGVESSAAISDTYDDGVALDLNDSWVAGADVNLVVTVTGGTGYLIGWLDWDGNNNFSDAGDEVRFGSLGVGVHTLTLTVPSGCCENETVNARFRLYDGRPLAISPTGAVTNGEVEDYQWEFGPTAVTVQGVDARSGMMLGASALLAVLAVAGLAALLLGRRFSRRPA